MPATQVGDFVHFELAVNDQQKPQAKNLILAHRGMAPQGQMQGQVPGQIPGHPQGQMQGQMHSGHAQQTMMQPDHMMNPMMNAMQNPVAFLALQRIRPPAALPACHRHHLPRAAPAVCGPRCGALACAREARLDCVPAGKHSRGCTGCWPPQAMMQHPHQSMGQPLGRMPGFSQQQPPFNLSQQFRGRIKSYNPEKGFGFIGYEHPAVA